MRAEREAQEISTSSERSRDRWPIFQIRIDWKKGNARNNSPSPKTRHFTGTCGASYHGTVRCGIQNQSSVVVVQRRLILTESARRRRIQPRLFVFESYVLDVHNVRTNRLHVGSIGIGKPSTARLVGSTSWWRVGGSGGDALMCQCLGSLRREGMMACACTWQWPLSFEWLLLGLTQVEGRVQVECCHRFLVRACLSDGKIAIGVQWCGKRLSWEKTGMKLLYSHNDGLSRENGRATKIKRFLKLR